MDSSTCLVFWPDKTVPHHVRTAKSGDVHETRSTFLVGWNPRGTMVCVADIISAPHADDAELELKQILTTHGEFLPGLRLIGRLHRPGALPASDDGAKQRKQGDIWVELLEGPSMIELHCCGIRVMNASLMVVHYSPPQQYSTTPARLSAVSRLGYHGVARAIARQRATTLVPGTISVAEGHYLAPHVANLNNNDKLPFRLPDVTVTNGSITGINQSFTQADSSQGLDLLHASQPASPGINDSNLSTAIAESEASNDSVHHHHPDGMPTAWDAKSIDPTVPPRLVFPTWASGTELSYMLRLINQTPELQKVVRDPQYVPYSDKFQPIRDGKAKAAVRKAVTMLQTLAVALLGIITQAARVSYVFAMLEFKLRELICCLAVGSHTAKCCGLHAFVPHSFITSFDPNGGARSQAADKRALGDSYARRRERRICLAHYVARNTVDVALGFLLSALVAHYSAQLSVWLGEVAWWGIYDLHIDYIEWFQGWPAGFKSNEELNEVIGLSCEGVFALWKYLIEGIAWEWTAIGLAMLHGIAPLGFSFAVSLVADICNLVTLHIRTMLHSTSVPYRTMKAIISTLLLQFRGKRRNPLRNRVDDWIFTSDEMILGILVGTATLFIAPTIAMYYLYFALARTVIWVLQESLRGAAMLATFIPAYPIFLWLTRRNELPSGVSFQRLRQRASVSSPSLLSVPASPVAASGSSPVGGVPTVVAEVDLVPMPMTLHEALAEFVVLAHFVFASTMNPGRIIRFVMNASEKPITDLRGAVFAHLIPDPTSPALPGTKI